VLVLGSKRGSSERSILDGVLPETERKRRANLAMRARITKLALASTKARSRGK